MLQFGTLDNVFKTGTKRLYTIFPIIKTLRLSGKNKEKVYHNLIHKQAIWVTFCRWNGKFLRAKWKKKAQYSQSRVTLREWPNREKEANFQSQLSYAECSVVNLVSCWWRVFLSFKNLKFCLNYVLQHSVKRKYQKI